MDNNPYQASTACLANEHKKGGSSFFKALKWILIGFGILFGLIVALIIWAGISTSKTYSKFEGRAEPFITEFLKSQDPWNYEVAKPLLSQAWIAITADEDGNRLFGNFNKLGKMTNIESITWQGCLSQNTTSGSVERCNYTVATSYENGQAAISFGLVVESEEIKLMQLLVNSEVFLQ